MWVALGSPPASFSASQEEIGRGRCQPLVPLAQTFCLRSHTFAAALVLIEFSVYGFWRPSLIIQHHTLAWISCSFLVGNKRDITAEDTLHGKSSTLCFTTAA